MRVKINGLKGRDKHKGWRGFAAMGEEFRLEDRAEIAHEEECHVTLSVEQAEELVWWLAVQLYGIKLKRAN
jgi:hypothetical protein